MRTLGPWPPKAFSEISHISHAAPWYNGFVRSAKLPLVMIEWVDSVQPRPNWQFLSDVGQPDVVKCASVGWLVADNKTEKSIVPNLGSTNTPDCLQVSGLLTIPTQAIIKVTRLKEPRLSRAFSLVVS